MQRTYVFYWLCCATGWDRLPQGGAHIPCITNILMRDFDNEVGAWCREGRSLTPGTATT